MRPYVICSLNIWDTNRVHRPKAEKIASDIPEAAKFIQVSDPQSVANTFQQILKKAASTKQRPQA